MLNDTAFGRDRRQDRRYAGVQVEYVFVSAEDNLENVRFKKGALRNFSKSGVNLTITESIPPSSYFLIRLYEPFESKKARYIHALGGLVWQQRSEELKGQGIIVGIKFLHLDEMDADRLNMLSQYFELSKARTPGRF